MPSSSSRPSEHNVPERLDPSTKWQVSPANPAHKVWTHGNFKPQLPWDLDEASPKLHTETGSEKLLSRDLDAKVFFCFFGFFVFILRLPSSTSSRSAVVKWKARYFYAQPAFHHHCAPDSHEARTRKIKSKTSRLSRSSSRALTKKKSDRFFGRFRFESPLWPLRAKAWTDIRSI